MREKCVLTREQVNLSSWRWPALEFSGRTKRLLCGFAALSVALAGGAWLAVSGYNTRASLKAQYPTADVDSFPI